MRVGIGYDSHRFTEGRPLILGGHRIPFDRGLSGHSDADPIAHAVTDAILGASGAGDIGQLFPDTDERWKDADSMRLLALAVERVFAKGYRIAQVDCTVIAEQPKIAPHVTSIASALAERLGCEPGDVSVKGKTNEGMGFIGRGEGIAVIAIATLEARR